MRIRPAILFLTLVLTGLFVMDIVSPAAMAAKSALSPGLDELPPETPSGTPQILSNDAKSGAETLDLPPPALPIQRSERNGTEYFHPYRQALTVRIGQALSSQTRNNTNSPTLIGAQYFFITELQQIYEAGADLFTDGTGALQIAKRWVYSRERFRPYTKLGAEVIIVPEDRIVTFLKYENYRLQAAAGFEALIHAPASARFEVEANGGTQGLQVLATLGYVWAW